MSTVRFATLCDICKNRSEEYSSWPTCRWCERDICSQCDFPEARIDADLGQPATTICRDKNTNCKIMVAAEE